MEGVLENYVFPVVCPKCGATQMQKTIGRFRENKEPFYLVTDELIGIIDELKCAIGPSNTTDP